MLNLDECIDGEAYLDLSADIMLNHLKLKAGIAIKIRNHTASLSSSVSTKCMNVCGLVPLPDQCWTFSVAVIALEILKNVSLN
jgi:hypothetical protein